MKRLIALFLVAILVLCTGCSSDKQSVSDEVLEARTALYAEFRTGETTVFPDNYAGCYFDDEGKKLVVNMVGGTSEYEFLRESYKCVELRSVEKTFSELENMAKQFENEVAEAFPELEYVYGEVNAEHNRVTIRLDDFVFDDTDLMDRLNAEFGDYPPVFEKPQVSYLL